MSYLSQMAGLAVQNFVSAAVGMAVLIAVIRGFRSRGSSSLGQLLAGPDPDPALHPAAAELRRRPDPDLPGRDPDPQRLGRPRDPHRHGRWPDAGAGPGGLAGRDQAARHQRRRLLQRQLGVPVREPDRVLGLRRDVLHPLDPRRAGVHLRAHGPQPPPGLGPVRGDGGADGGRARGHLRGRAERLARRRRRPGSSWPPETGPRAATSRARSSATGSSPAPNGPASPPTPRTAR